MAATIIMTIVSVLMLGVSGYLTFLVIKKDKLHRAELRMLNEQLSKNLEEAVKSINEENKAQTQIIEDRSNEEKFAITDSFNELKLNMQNLETTLVTNFDYRLNELKRMSDEIHRDVHETLKNVVFDNFPTKEDKVKSKVLDKLGLAVKFATKDSTYLDTLMQVLAKSEELEYKEENEKEELRKANVIIQADSVLNKNDIQAIKAGEEPVISDEQFRKLTEILKQ